MRLPTTIGVDRPPYGARHRKFCPLRAQLSIRPVSFETPSRLGPRMSGQSPIATRRAPWAPTPRAERNNRAAMATARVLDIGSPLECARRVRMVPPALEECQLSGAD